MTDSGRTTRFAWGVVIVALALFLLTVWLMQTRDRAVSRRDAPMSVSDVMGGAASADAGFRRVTVPRPFVFPADHGPHPEYKHEWWYFTGNLKSANGRLFGFQVTFFRIALTPDPVNSESAWAANQFYMAHFALTDVANRRFYAYERFARAALDLAGAQSQPFRVWLEDWQATGNDNEMFPLQLKVAEQDVALELNLQQGKNIVPQGDNGMSRKSSMPGNASYYYSLTRMPVSGAARIDDVTVPVNGSAWMDREWSTSALGREQAGWDWFALQLDDQREIMFYRLRNKDGTIDEHSGGSLVMQDGTKQTLNADDVVIDVREHWRSPKTSIRYPSGWRLTIPAQSLTLDIEPVIKNQELDLSVRYWEGAVSVTGDAGDKPVTGVGYVELAGYE